MSEIRTCEEYVLAELNDLRAENEALRKSMADVLGYLDKAATNLGALAGEADDLLDTLLRKYGKSDERDQ